MSKHDTYVDEVQLRFSTIALKLTRLLNHQVVDDFDMDQLRKVFNKMKDRLALQVNSGIWTSEIRSEINLALLQLDYDVEFGMLTLDRHQHLKNIEAESYKGVIH